MTKMLILFFLGLALIFFGATNAMKGYEAFIESRRRWISVFFFAVVTIAEFGLGFLCLRLT